jgi:hypothetical protein
MTAQVLQGKSNMSPEYAHKRLTEVLNAYRPVHLKADWDSALIKAQYGSVEHLRWVAFSRAAATTLLTKDVTEKILPTDPLELQLLQLLFMDWWQHMELTHMGFKQRIFTASAEADEQAHALGLLYELCNGER